jgi:hypothetical protein
MNAYKSKDGLWVVTLSSHDRTRVFEGRVRTFFRALQMATATRDAAEGVSTLDAWRGKAA